MALALPEKASMPEQPDNERSAFTVDQFCVRNQISKSSWFKLRRAGLAPRVLMIGNSARITREAEAAWQRRMERAAEGREERLRVERRRASARIAGRAAAESPNHISRQRERQRQQRRRQRRRRSAG
jgi:hypothetical protein